MTDVVILRPSSVYCSLQAAHREPDYVSVALAVTSVALRLRFGTIPKSYFTPSLL